MLCAQAWKPGSQDAGAHLPADELISKKRNRRRRNRPPGPKSQGFTCKTVGLVVGEAEEVRGLATADNESQASLCTSAHVHPLRLWALLSEPLWPCLSKGHGKQRVNVHSPTLAFC